MRLFEWIHDIEDKNALYSIDPFKHKNGHVNNNTPFGYCADPIRLSNIRTKPKIGRQAFGTSGSKLETQATERLYKDALPGIHRFIPILYSEPSTCLFQIKPKTICCFLSFLDNDFEVKLYFSLARLEA